jgi:DNA-directed RNA polymerase subunit RPC12/RpoP
MQEQTWTMVLRCYECAGKFTLTHMPLARLTTVQLIAVCPHCSARPHSAAGTLHRIFDLRCEHGHAPKSAA